MAILRKGILKHFTQMSETVVNYYCTVHTFLGVDQSAHVSANGLVN